MFRIGFHGDYIIQKVDGSGRRSYQVLGRSDATLNAGGVRIDSAEIYAVLDTIPKISDSFGHHDS